MEVIIDQLDTVKSNSNIEKVNNPEKVTNLIIKNYNKEAQWNILENFINLEILQLENCWLDNFKSYFRFRKHCWLCPNFIWSLIFTTYTSL